MSLKTSNICLPKAKDLSFCIIFIILSFSVTCSMPADYLATRKEIISLEQSLRTGGNGSTLSPDEILVNKLIMTEKQKIIDDSRINGSSFPPRNNFITSRAAMENTVSFKVISKMPKGGVLHVHDESLTSIDWLVKNATYRPNCYMCLDSNFSVNFHFYKTPPTQKECVWRLVSDFRKESGNISAFDQTLHNNITLVTPDPKTAYPTIDVVWARFMDYFDKVEGLVLYAPVFEDYLYEGLRQFSEDNVQYVEIRCLLPEVYELDGSTHNKTWVLALYKRVVNQFLQDHQDFIGAKVIYSSLRYQDTDAIMADIKQAIQLHKDNSDFMVGFDLVGQEDPFNALIFYLNDLLYPSQQSPPANLPYFFHAGETDWQGTSTDYNLLDAVLLNTSRIGHGFAIYKHPLLKKLVREKNIAVEINPISNQVLMLVSDLRNHPASSLIAEDYPLIISSDDPAAWEAAPLSHDFYVTFMALTDEDAGLATLKQLAENSIMYSAMGTSEKGLAMKKWQEKWDAFIKNVIQEFKLRRY